MQETFNQTYVSFNQNDENFTIAVSNVTTKSSLEKWVLDLYTSNPSTPQYTTRQIKLNDTSAIEYFGCAGVEGCQDTYFILAEKDNNLYQISYNVPRNQHSLYNQILSTFKFLP